jgi:hypothetical protein
MWRRSFGGDDGRGPIEATMLTGALGLQARRQRARSRCAWGEGGASLLGVLLCALAAGCGEDRAPETPLPASTWRQIDDGWAKTIPLESPVVFDVGEVGPSGAFDALVFPAGPGALVVESESGTARIAVDGARRVTVPLFNSDPLTVRFEGAAGASLHAARIVSDAGARAPTKPGPSPVGAGGARRVLLVVIDTLRADAVDSSMPELLDLFADGTRFMRAYSPASWTLPAMASILTGRSPPDLALPDGTLIALAPGESTIASDFAARGFYTAAVSANYTVHHENGFSAGCELFLVPSVLGHGDWPDAGWVLERARRVLQWFPDRDLFLYLHLMDPHDPYRESGSGESLAAPATGQTDDHAAAARLRAAYLDEARGLSARLAEFVRESGPFELVVVTADHGEEFLEHGGWRHGPTVYPEVSRVPLLVRGTGIAAAEVARPVSLVDLRHFLAEAAGAGGETEWPTGSMAEVVSFVHAGPRFGWAHDGGEAILFARDLAPPAVEDPIGKWLRAHHPRLDFVDADGAERAAGENEAADAALLLTARFHGLAAGSWLWVPPSVERLRVEIEGASGGGWWWGGARGVELSSAGAGSSSKVLEVTAPDPFALVFVPAIEGGRLSLVEGVEPMPLAGPPSVIPDEGAVAWRDRGRPPAALEGVEQTMRRLRAQGYL